MLVRQGKLFHSRLLLCVFLFSFALSTLATLLSMPTTSAQSVSWTTPVSSARLEVVANYIQGPLLINPNPGYNYSSCGAWHTEFDQDDINDISWHDGDGDSHNVTNNVRSEIGTDLTPTCRTLAAHVSGILSPDSTRAGFVKVFYDADNQTNTYRLKDEFTINGSYNGTKIGEKLAELAEAKGYYIKRGSSYRPADPLMARWYGLRPAFQACFQSAPADESELFSLSGNRYKYKASPGDEIAVIGDLWVSRLNALTGLTDGGQNGKVTCDTFAEAIKKEPGYLRILSAPDAARAAQLINNEVSENAESELRAAMLSNWGKVSACINEFTLTGNQDYDRFRALPSAEAIGSIMHSFVNKTDTFTTEGTTLGALGGDFTVNVLTTAAIKQCISEDNTFKSLVEQLDYTPINIDDVAEPSDDSGEAPAADDCDGIVPSGWGSKLNPGSWMKNAMDWFGCAVAKGLTNVIDGLSSSLSSSLSTDADGIERELRDVWAKFVQIANALFVVAFLIMILSTALNLGLFDAYTVKKLLPRIIIAAVLANLSFALCLVMINFFNVLGAGVGEMVGGLVPGQESLVGAGAGTAITAAIGGAIAGIALGGLFIIVPSLLSALLAIIIAYATILIRRIVIIMLVVLAPIAAVLWILPGGENIAKRWWKTFIQMLVMYPLIIAFMASGQVASSIYLQSTGEANMFEGLTALLLLILPMVTLPAVFKLATSTIGNLTGIVNDRGKGLIDRSRKARGARVADRWDKAKSKSLEGPGGKLWNPIASRVGAGWRGRYGFGQKGQQRLSANYRDAAARQMKDPLWQQVQHDDDAMRTATYASAAEARRHGMSEQNINKIESTIGFGKRQQMAAAQQMLLNKTAYEDAADVARTIARVSGGNDDAAESLRGFNNAYAKQVGRHDLSAVSSEAIQRSMFMEGIQGARQYDAQENARRLRELSDESTVKGFENADTYTLGRENAASYRNMAEVNARQYREAVSQYAQGGGSRDEVVAARARLEETLKTAASATGVNAREITGLSDDIAYSDATLRQHRPAEADSIFHDATTTLGYGGIPRTGGNMTEAERRAREQQAQQGRDNDD